MLLLSLLAQLSVLLGLQQLWAPIVSFPEQELLKPPLTLSLLASSIQALFHLVLYVHLKALCFFCAH